LHVGEPGVAPDCAYSDEQSAAFALIERNSVKAGKRRLANTVATPKRRRLFIFRPCRLLNGCLMHNQPTGTAKNEECDNS